jgi:hypothetical protein
MCLTNHSPLPVHIVRMMATQYANILQAYGPYYCGQDSGFFMSPSILERKFRVGVEVYTVEQDGGMFWYLATSTIHSLVDAMLQVRDLVGNFCHTMEHIDNYDPGSPLYGALQEARITYPAEPSRVNPYYRPGTPFQTEFWEPNFSSKEELDCMVAHCQLWAMGMIVALHCLSLYNGRCAHCIPMDLPPWPCGHMKVARAHWQLCQDWAEDNAPQPPSIDPALTTAPVLPSDTVRDSDCLDVIFKIEEEEEEESNWEFDHGEWESTLPVPQAFQDFSHPFHWFFGAGGSLSICA